MTAGGVCCFKTLPDADACNTLPTIVDGGCNMQHLQGRQPASPMCRKMDVAARTGLHYQLCRTYNSLDAGWTERQCNTRANHTHWHLQSLDTNSTHHDLKSSTSSFARSIDVHRNLTEAITGRLAASSLPALNTMPCNMACMACDRNDVRSHAGEPGSRACLWCRSTTLTSHTAILPGAEHTYMCQL